MSDQASELRSLMLRASRERAAAAAPPPKLITVLGGTIGVGATTLAVNLSLAVAQQGLRAVLVDANLGQPAIAGLCGIRETHSIADVLVARRDIHEVLVRGPSGLQILPGVSSASAVPEFGAKGERRLFQQIHSLGLFTDLVVADVGDASQALTRQFWQVSTLRVLVTTCDASSVMDCYAALKTLHAVDDCQVVRLVVNRAPDEATAGDVVDRIDRSCRRFLGCRVELAGYLPDSQQRAGSAVGGQPAMLARPGDALARAIQGLAARLIAADGKGTNWSGTSVA